MSAQRAEALHTEIAACTLCAEHLPLGPRPVVQFSPASRILIIGQAPGTRVHASGIAWDDDSGDRLRGWLEMEKDAFYDPAKVALMPMGFCYPGKAKGGDAPPRKECAPAWHDRILALLPEDRLTLLVGAYAQAAYLPATRKLSMTDRVKRGAEFAPFFPLPHPAWRVRMWMASNPWYEAETLPALRRQIAARLG
ncbi:IclR family transcriptional regulator [Erythrobacter sp. KY5]|uniref:uracil-DNA glycosylase family protein n=1 Tax=Erythrobacter sp. KY5 TaxID=2011159 RepID=UPI000DBF185C|nr:uracil-DNA glycosylase family protein [Erythrobacter sp. KY5]AWW74304.1 IclR family transcriptional regulator [Erythrobacter sp. KY5]